MSENLVLPAMLDLPNKLIPFITEFNDNKYFLAEGGRGGGKTHALGRIILYICEVREVRVVCGREIQGTIEESVYTLLADLIRDYELDFTITKTYIKHNKTGSTIKFKGFREHGSVNIKGLEGVDILWIDEAEAITKPTLDIIVPTIRKDKAKIFFTMNRKFRKDSVPGFIAGRKNALRVKLNYYDNKHCPQTLIDEALACKEESYDDYKHIWLGEPKAASEDYLFNFDRLYDSLKADLHGDYPGRQRVLGIDFAGQGDDFCCASVLDRDSMEVWDFKEKIKWKSPDTMQSVGKIVSLIGKYQPDVTVLDVGGMGHVVYDRLVELGLKIERFDGAAKPHDLTYYQNTRAEGYYNLKKWIEENRLKVHHKDDDVLEECEYIKTKFGSNGKRLIQSKVDMKKEGFGSPDMADSLMMAAWAAQFKMGISASSSISIQGRPVKRIKKTKRKW